MPDDRQNNSASEIISKGANAAQTIQSAVKTGKAIAGAAKGAAAGGPYGALAMGLWQNRKLVVKVILAVCFIMILPILFLLMLPALIFGGFTENTDPEVPIMNDNAAIYANIEDIYNQVSEIIDLAHADLLKIVNDEITKQTESSEYEILDDSDSEVLYDSALVISQYQAYKDNYEEIAVADLVSVLKQHKSELFSYTVTSEERENKIIKVVEKTVTEYIDRVVIDTNGSQHIEKIEVIKTVQEEIEEIEIKTVYTYIITFVGSDYFADSIFRLTPDKKAYAKDLANNLTIFLKDMDN